jgi:hypothetical protein
MLFAAFKGAARKRKYLPEKRRRSIRLWWFW